MLRRIASRTLREPVLRASSPAPQPATGTSAAVLAHQYQLMQQSRGLVSSVLLSSTRDSYESKKMAELRSELKTRGLSSTGRKDELIKRLVDHDSVINGSTASTAALPLRKKSTLASLRKEDGGSKDTPSPPGAPTTQAGTKTNKGNPPSADASRRNDKAGPTVDAETARAVEKGTKPLGSLKPSETPANLEPGSVHNAAADGLASDANAKASPGTEEQRGVPVQKTTPPGLPPQKAPAAKETFNIQIPYYPDPPEPQIEIPIVTSYTSPHIKRSDANTASSGFEPKAISVSASSAIMHAADLSSHGSPDASESSEKAKGIFSEILSDLEKQSGSDLSAVNKGVESAKQAFSSIGEQAKGAFASAAGQVADATGASSSSSSASSSSSSSSSSSGSGSSGNKSNRPLTDEERTGALVLLGIVTGGFVLGGLGKPKKQKHDDKEHDAKSASDGAAQAPAGSQGKPVAVTPLLPVAALPQADGSVKSQGEGEGSGSAIPTPAGSKVKAPIMCVPKGTQVASSSSSSSPLASAAFSQPLSSTTLARLAQLSTCEASDALIKLKVPHGGLVPGLDAYSPMPLEGAKLCGPAYTVRMVAGTDDGAPRPKGHFVDEAEGHSGHVMVVSAPIGTKSAVWGGLMTARAQQLGLVGAVLDANVRDLSEHRQSLFPVFARGHSTLGQSPFTRPSEYQIPLTIHVRSTAAHDQDEDPQDPKTNPRFPNITIHPGDIVLADLDGVVIIPPSLALDVIRIAEKGKAQDALCLKDIQNGMPVIQAFAKNRT